jgi:glucokinase-like ROK family protein
MSQLQRVRFRTGDQALVREINLSLVMNYLHKHAPISRATLAGMTGLNKTTVSSLVHELIEQRFVHEIGYDTSGVGRPAVLLELNPAAGYIVSGEIGVDFISVIRTDFAAEIVWRHREDTQPGMSQRGAIDRTLALLRQAVDSASGARGGLLGLAVGVPGLVDQPTGTLLFAPNLGWRNVPLGKTLEGRFDAPVFVDNEANLAALGEHYFGAAQGYDEVLYISAGVGLGGGIVRNGILFRGKTGMAGEFGHMTMDPEGEQCNCGNRGCWETLVSQSALFRRIRRAVKQGQNSMLVEMTGGDLDELAIPLVVDAARAGDSVTLQALEEVGRYLGIGIASLVNALDPDLVVFGGILSLAAEYLLPRVETELQQRVLNWATSPIKIVLPRHGVDGCVMGGVAIVYQTILQSRPSQAWQGSLAR